MMNKSLRLWGRESSGNRIIGYQLMPRTKKSRRFRRLLKLITGRRQTEWTGATRCPNKDDLSHIRESLIDRKRTVLFRRCLPCRPLAELPCPGRGAAFFMPRRRAGTVTSAGVFDGPGSAAHHAAKSGALRCFRGASVHDLKKLFAASFDERFLPIASLSRSIS